jgi:hypothetical protein
VSGGLLVPGFVLCFGIGIRNRRYRVWFAAVAFEHWDEGKPHRPSLVFAADCVWSGIQRASADASLSLLRAQIPAKSKRIGLSICVSRVLCGQKRLQSMDGASGGVRDHAQDSVRQLRGRDFLTSRSGCEGYMRGRCVFDLRALCVRRFPYSVPACNKESASAAPENFLRVNTENPVSP